METVDLHDIKIDAQAVAMLPQAAMQALYQIFPSVRDAVKAFKAAVLEGRLLSQSDREAVKAALALADDDHLRRCYANYIVGLALIEFYMTNVLPPKEDVMSPGREVWSLAVGEDAGAERPREMSEEYLN